jgi:NADH dehydrogenase
MSIAAEESASIARRPRVVIVGGGFGGLACASALGNANVDVTLIDRRNHNLFQPLLYQVATAILSPADISEPLRRTLGRYRNISVVLAEVCSVDTQRKAVLTGEGAPIAYDTLVLATGSVYNYFGHDDWPAVAPGLKTNREARFIRESLLLGFERAEIALDPAERRRNLTAVVVGGGPTGVEMAGAMAELGAFLIERDFRNLARDEFRIILVEASPGVLAGFDPELSAYALKRLQKIGVEVRTRTPVEAIEEGLVTAGGERIEAATIVWGAGVRASPVAQWLGVAPGPSGRVPVEPDLSIADLADVYLIGDVSAAKGEDGKVLPALAQVAKQQGAYLGKALRARLSGRAAGESFKFRNRGSTAVIGRNAAVFQAGRWRLKGRVAWFLWALIHVYLLVNFEKRLLVSVQWLWTYLTRQRNARVIDDRF